MTGGKHRHVCHPGWELLDGMPYETGMLDPLGTRFFCSCGKVYIAYRDPVSMVAEFDDLPTHVTNKWRQEHWWERWWRKATGRRQPAKSDGPVGPPC